MKVSLMNYEVEEIKISLEFYHQVLWEKLNNIQIEMLYRICDGKRVFDKDAISLYCRSTNKVIKKTHAQRALNGLITLHIVIPEGDGVYILRDPTFKQYLTIKRRNTKHGYKYKEEN